MPWGKYMYFISKWILTGTMLCLFVFSSRAEHHSFEGHISFIKKTYFDTLYINFYIKGSKARINQYTQDGTMLHSLLADIEKERVIAVNPERKMYKVLDLKEESNHGQERLKIIKSGNFREIQGVKCYQWRVRDEKTNSEIAYWVAQKDLDFMNELMHLISRTDKIYQFFSVIPGNEGYFPMLSVERTLLRKERQRVVVQDIVRKDLDDNLFRIPGSFVEFSQ